jgi:hypothetical protein
VFSVTADPFSGTGFQAGDAGGQGIQNMLLAELQSPIGEFIPGSSHNETGQLLGIITCFFHAGIFPR